jgi:P-type Cu+ transporter
MGGAGRRRGFDAPMHREYHPEDMNHLRAHAFAGGEDHAHEEDHRGLYTLTAVLGLLIGGDVLFGALGWEAWRVPLGVSLALVAAILGGARIVYGALEALVAGRVGADLALAQACVAALVLGRPFVAAEVVFIAMVGEVLEAVTARRALRAIRRLFDQAPRTARVRRDGVEVTIPSGEVVVGDLVVVGAGERVPVDGAVVAGRSAVDQAALTGESAPVDKGPGEEVYTGSINQFGTLEVRAEKVGHDTTMGQVLRLVAEAQRRKAPLQRTADRLARYFLPAVEAVAVLTVVAGYALGWRDTWERAVAVLVVACPCALVLATPAAVMASMAWLARHGVVIKGGAALERLAGCDTFAFDKTGTLTLGRPEPAGVVALAGWDEADVLRLAAAAERAGTHPLAVAVRRAAESRGLVPPESSDIVAMPGAGVAARCRFAGEDRRVLVGNRRLLAEHGVPFGDDVESALRQLDARGETPLIVAVDGTPAGLIGARDAVRREAHDVIHDLKHLKIAEVALLTGDRASAAAVVAKRVHIKVVEAELRPGGKADWIRDRQAAGRRVAMVGDGINDAPALAQADVGIALGGVGSDLAAEAGDLVVLGEPLKVLPGLVKLSRATVAVIRQNILGFAFGLNAAAMGAAALGVLGPVAAAVLHQAGSLLVLLNAMRLLAFGDWRESAPARRLGDLGRGIRRLDERLDPGRAAGLLRARWRVVAGAAAAIAVAAYGLSGTTAIGPDKLGLVTRGGRLVARIGPGLHLRWPLPIERVVRVEPARVRGVAVGTSDEGEPLLTGDGQLVELEATVQYRLDPRPEALRRYAFGATDADAAVRPLAEAAVRAVVGRRTLDELLTARRHEAEDEAARRLARRVADYGLGLEVIGFAFQELHPPLAVVDAFRDVSRAEGERQRRINEAATYAAERLAEARGRAAALVSRAEAEGRRRVARAGGEADAFRDRLEARAPHPDLTDRALYHEAIAAAVAGKPKLILDPARAAARRHLILPEFPSGATSPAAKAALVAPAGKGEGASGP